MPFKIVQTIEKGIPKLTIVPSCWENNGYLRIPKIGASKLVSNGDSKPLQGWTAMKCTVKRSYFSTYKKAEEELSLMENKSDTDVPENEEVNILQTTNYNAIAENLQLVNRSVEQEIPGSSINTSANATPAEFQYIYSGGDILTNNPPNINIEPQSIEIETISFEEILENQKKIIENQKVILQNQCIMQETQKFMLEKEDKNGRQIANLAVLIDDCFTRLSRQNSTVVSLSDAKDSEKEYFSIKPLTSIKELEELECLLSDQTEKLKLKKRFEFLCSITPGNGVSCAYKLLDIIFSRDFLCKCSWSGGSRGMATKIPLKGFKNILGFFYDMIHSWDPVYTRENNEFFFKIVTKNALKRSEIKNLRASTKRKRLVEKVATDKKKKTEKAQETDKNGEKAAEEGDQENMETNVEDKNYREKEEDEEEESLL